MKKTIAILLLTVMALTVVACSAKNKLVGTWGDAHQSVTFKKDGSGTFTENGIDYPMTYSVEGDVLTMTIDGETDTCSFRIEGNTLILKTRYETIEFTRK